MPVQDLFRFRRGTAAAWTSANPTLAAGEMGVETDTRKSKIGDGLTSWSSLLYTVAGTALAVAVGNLTGAGTGVLTWLATPSSANLAAALTDETGSGALVFGTAPTITTSLTVNGTIFINQPSSVQSMDIFNGGNQAEIRIGYSAGGCGRFGYYAPVAVTYIDVGGGASYLIISGNGVGFFDVTSTAANAYGDFKIATAGKGLYVKEGTNATMGVATLVLGTVVVSTTKVTANSRIFLMHQNLGTITVPVGVAVSARTAGTSFTILSANLSDTSSIAWMIVEPA